MKTWTDEEVLILKENYNKVSNTALLGLLPNKNLNSIGKKARRLGIKKAKDIEFLNRSEARLGERASNWKGGIRKTSGGYRQLLIPNHQRADASGYVMEHIVVWERETGMMVPSGFCIHHLNGNKADNRIENLSLMLHKAHTAFHHTGKKRSQETKDRISEARRNRSAKYNNHNGTDC